jgi:type III restriction enzyme
MVQQFFERPILNSPYGYPGQHWELDADGQPTDRIINTRRRSDLITPVPKPKKRRQGRGQAQLLLADEAGLSSDEQEYNPRRSSTRSGPTSRPGATCRTPTSGS